MSRSTRPIPIAAALLGALLIAGCGEESAPRPDAPATDGEAAPSAAPAGGSGARWTGEVTGGYTGNRLSFEVADDGASIREVAFEGNWDCTDGIETATLGPDGAFPLQNGRIEITSVDPPDGGATATRFVLSGQLAAGRAQGTLRANINALGCDTRELRWTAAPAAE